MSHSSVVRARIDERTKKQAAALKKMGLPCPMLSACSWCAWPQKRPFPSSR